MPCIMPPEDASISLFDFGASLIEGAPPGLLPILGGLAGVLLLIGAPVLILEVWRLHRAGRLTRTRIAGMVTSAFCLLPAALVEIALGALLAALFFAAATLAPWPIATTWASALLCFLLVDFFYYCEHRLAHEVNALWSLYHSVHHSADHYDQTIALRISFVDFFFAPLVYLPLVLAGFHPVLVFACLGLVLAWQQWIHTELVGKLPLLDPWLNTPSNHRVHHGRNPIYIDKNYGGFLMVWDRMFGTYAAETEKVEYGLVEQLDSRNPVAVHFSSLGKLLTALWQARSLRRAMTVLFGKPRAG
jgi:sterol desaturase/sphingolipid hydroxylase (fatty acid hydroxylase superfamily)